MYVTIKEIYQIYQITMTGTKLGMHWVTYDYSSPMH